MASLSVKNAIKRFGSVEVLKGIEVAVEDGELLVLVGPSGCGKSTLLSLIAGLDTISEGEIRIDGQLVNDLHPKDRDIAMVFQSYALYPHMSVALNISFGLEMRGVPRPERERLIAEVAKLLQIGHLLARKPGQLSGGQRQRVAMGRALVRKPKIFLFDEPLSNLDAKLRVEMRTEIKKLHQRLKATIIYVTHDQIEAMTLATRIAVLNGGILHQLGTPKEIYETPANLFVASFMGSPSMNLIPGRIEVNGAGPAVAIERSGGAPIILPVANGAAEGLRTHAGREVVLGLRPEHFSDPHDADAQAPGHHPIDCHVEVTEPTGADTLAVVVLGGVEVTARLKADSPVRPGTPATLAVDMTKAVLFDPRSERRI